MQEKLTSTEIERLVAKTQKGDEKSFELLFQAFFPKILRYTSFKIPEQEVEDIVSDIFLKVVEKINSYKVDKKAGFNAWIFCIAHNKIIDFYRQKKEILGLENDEEGENFFLQIQDESPLPNESANHSFNRKRLQSILKKMPLPQREILELKYLEGFTNNEIARITGKSEGNIRVLQLRALREIRKLWERE